MNEKADSLDILVVEDNETMRFGISESLRRSGYTVHDFDNGQDALQYFEKKPLPVVVADLKMEPVDGMAVLRRVKEIHPACEVLMISAFGNVEVAVKAMQLGAADFLTKPFSNEELRIRIKKIADRILQSRAISRLQDENRLLRDELADRYPEMIGTSEGMRNIFALIERVAVQDSAVLITGESGTGKELVARAIHNRSGRREKPFVKINCAALNDNLLESELFGHEKGAFTGAIKKRRGRFELAHEGTLFLDEIGDISPAMQVKLLRVLQEKQFERLGGEETLQVDVRIVAATNRELSGLIKEGKFRQDLYYRLSVIPFHLPPLRERKEDIPLLADYFLQKLAGSRTQEPRRFPAEALKMLQEYSWPGNIRELENLVERLHVISGGPVISPQLLAAHLGSEQVNGGLDQHLPLEEALSTFERNLLSHALEQSEGVKNQAARLLGIKTSTLYYKMDKYGLH
ncbi:MAG: sigma-54 dependent transcriptional regulator [Calditrichia bacterium]